MTIGLGATALDGLSQQEALDRQDYANGMLISGYASLGLTGASLIATIVLAAAGGPESTDSVSMGHTGASLVPGGAIVTLGGQF